MKPVSVSIGHGGKMMFLKLKRFFAWINGRVYIGVSPNKVPCGAIVLFPFRPGFLCCGLAGLVTIAKNEGSSGKFDTSKLSMAIADIEGKCCRTCLEQNRPLQDEHLGGDGVLHDTLRQVQYLKQDDPFSALFQEPALQAELKEFAQRCHKILTAETDFMAEDAGRLGAEAMDVMAKRIELLRDIYWCITVEILGNIEKINDLSPALQSSSAPPVLAFYKKINTVLNSIDRLEVRGRDSAGLSLIFILAEEDFSAYRNMLTSQNLLPRLEERSNPEVLRNASINLNTIRDAGGASLRTITFVYKIAAEIGRLGDNVTFLRQQIRDDELLHFLAFFPIRYHTVQSHTRWASVGAITEANCHPVDNCARACDETRLGIIHVCLNGDIDNFQSLKQVYENQSGAIPDAITTDTKIIPLQVEHYVQQGHDIGEAFRRAVNDFEGSHAISMHTDLAPGKLFLAQKGSGQAIFIGLGHDHYMPVSEVYGFVEETPHYIKMDGEKTTQGVDGVVNGQIFVLDQNSQGGLGGIDAMYYDGTAIELTAADVMCTDITSRDIDRQGFPHYFLKEISESPRSVERTLQSRWQVNARDHSRYDLVLDQSVLPLSLQSDLKTGKIRRLFFIGQGTAGVAAKTCVDILTYYLDDPTLQVRALKASELSGFQLKESDTATSMADTMVVAISQSGTTTDTNRCVDMVNERGATTIAIVNRRDSDLTFKADGVLYTSGGRDIEMSVASTKAFYSQIVAGALLGLNIARIKGRRDHTFISDELKQLLGLPGQMKEILSDRESIARSAGKLAAVKTYWAVVGSGPNKSAADEIRIKLSELCYKTISSDFVEDKKHIDLSSEPLIIVCAAGTRGPVIGDVIKDTAIFKAHKATPVVIADRGETRFGPVAEDVIHVPVSRPHLSPILNTLVGHLWGYYAALTLNEGSGFLFNFREDIQNTINTYSAGGGDVYELVLERAFKEKVATFYKEFRTQKPRQRIPEILGIKLSADLTLLLKYLSGRLPVSDFEIDFGLKGTAGNMLDTLLRNLSEGINILARPVDAIKHQAKTVTVGTSRIEARTEGILFEALKQYRISVSQLINRNVLVLRNLQHIVAEIHGAILYRIAGLNLLGEPTDETTIEVIEKDGVLKPLPSRVEIDTALKGTKRIIVSEGNVYIGKGRKDDRSIIVVPALSDSPDTPNIIENLLLMNIGFAQNVPLAAKVKALGGKYEHIKNIVAENSIEWEDHFLEQVEMAELFGHSAEKISELVVSWSRKNDARE
jgi:glutamine---fructose-6-phosphate transaminase (isomerizing)